MMVKSGFRGPALGVLAFLALLGVQPVSLGGGSLAQDLDPERVKTGKEAYGEACIVCHGPAKMMLQRKNFDGWLKTVYTMTSRGAPVLPGEAEAIAAFLADAYGPDSPPPVLGESPDEAAELPSGEGRAILVGACGRCHPVDLIVNSNKSAAEWKETVATMRDFGADVDPKQEEVLVGYLSRHFGSR